MCRLVVALELCLSTILSTFTATEILVLSPPVLVLVLVTYLFRNALGHLAH